MVRQNVSEFLQFGRIFDKDGRGVESETSSANGTPMDVDKAKERDASSADVPATQRKTASSMKPKAKARAKERQRVPRLTRIVPPRFNARVAVVARKVTSGQAAGSVWQKRKRRKSTPLMERRRLRRWRQWKRQEIDEVGPTLRTTTQMKHGF